MKKKLIGLMAAIMTMSLLTGCSSEPESELLKDIPVEKYVTLGEYKGLQVSVPAITVDAEEQEYYVTNIYLENFPAEKGITDRAIVEGDTANIDYVGKKDGVAFDGGTAEGYNLTIGSGQFIDGFEAGLVGVTPGETVDLNLTFPEGYSSTELSGQAVVFTVTVNYIIPAEMDAEVIAGMGVEEVTDEESLNQYVYDALYAVGESTYQNNLQSAIMETLMLDVTVKKVPQSLIDRYKVTAGANISSEAAYYGMDVDTFTNNAYGMDYESFLGTYCEEAAKQDVALQAIANKEGLNIDDAELESLLAENAAEGGYATVEEFLGESSKEDYREYFMYDKVLNFLIENAVVTEY